MPRCPCRRRGGRWRTCCGLAEPPDRAPPRSPDDPRAHRSRLLADPADERLREIATWIGVAEQLLGNRLNQLLAPHDLQVAQFALLNHFRRDPRAVRSVTGLARAFQVSQPAMTKLVQRLLAKDFLASTPDPGDGRSRHLTITPGGIAAHQAALAVLAPELRALFADWPEADLAALHRLLFRLKSRLDDARNASPETTVLP